MYVYTRWLCFKGIHTKCTKNKMGNDLFEHTVLCNKCDKKMSKVVVHKNGFNLRALQCPNCGQRTYHPSDLEEFQKFSQLKNQNFKVKLRLVGNSYAVSIPREIIDFFGQAEEDREEREDVESRHPKHMRNEVQNIHERMERMVTLALEQANKLSLSFNHLDEDGESNDDDDSGVNERKYAIEKNGVKTMIHEKSQVKHINTKNTKGFIARKVKVMRSIPKKNLENAEEIESDEEMN